LTVANIRAVKFGTANAAIVKFENYGGRRGNRVTGSVGKTALKGKNTSGTDWVGGGRVS